MKTKKLKLKAERDELREAGQAVLAHADRLEQHARQTEAAHQMMTQGFLRQIRELEQKNEDLLAQFDSRGVEIGHLYDMVRERDAEIKVLRRMVPLTMSLTPE